MKKTLLFVMTVMLLVLFGCISEDTKPAMDEVPMLKIANGQSEADAARFGYTWEIKNRNGKSSVKIADSTNPLDDADSLPVISILPTYVSSINPMNAYLMFDIVPDEVTARCWDMELHNEESADVEIRDAYLEDGTYWSDIILKLENKNCIYEITAEWSSYEDFCGTATYCFRTEGEIINHINGFVVNE